MRELAVTRSEAKAFKELWDADRYDLACQIQVLTEELDAAQASEEALFEKLGERTLDLEILQESYVNMSDRCNDGNDEIADLRDQLSRYQSVLKDRNAVFVTHLSVTDLRANGDSEKIDINGHYGSNGVKLINEEENDDRSGWDEMTKNDSKGMKSMDTINHNGRNEGNDNRGRIASDGRDEEDGEDFEDGGEGDGHPSLASVSICDISLPQRDTQRPVTRRDSNGSGKRDIGSEAGSNDSTAERRAGERQQKRMGMGEQDDGEEGARSGVPLSKDTNKSDEDETDERSDALIKKDDKSSMKSSVDDDYEGEEDFYEEEFEDP